MNNLAKNSQKIIEYNKFIFTAIDEAILKGEDPYLAGIIAKQEYENNRTLAKLNTATPYEGED